MLRLNWITRQHLAAFGLWVGLLLLNLVSPGNEFGFGAWLDGFYRITVEGYPLKVLFATFKLHWTLLLWLALFYWMFNGTYFLGIKDRITTIDRGDDRPPLILLPFLHPDGPDRMLVAHLTGYRFGINTSPWLRFYFVTLGFFSLAFVFALIVAVYTEASGFPSDLFSAWGLAFLHWQSVWHDAASSSHNAFYAGLISAYVYWRHGAPLVAEWLVNTDTAIGRFLRKHCLAEYTEDVQDLVREHEERAELARALRVFRRFR